MGRPFGALVVSVALVLTGTQSPAAEPADPHVATTGRRAADPVSHDPSVIRQGRYFYSFSTGDVAHPSYLPVQRSTDLLHWTAVGTVFTAPPEWVTRELGFTPESLWAPDISFFDGLYHLYYAGSSFGSNNSVIGLATSPTLDPASPAYRWTDRGMVLRSSTTDDYNAIDPELFVDVDGTAWLAFGSFWDGIRMRRLDRVTGMPADQASYSLASRGGASVEAPSILRHGGYYYLFASFDYCCRGVDSDYRLVVGRATRVTGPYVDRAGVPMTASGGTDLLRGYNEFRGPGHSDTLTTGGTDWLVHHYYDLAEGGTPKQSVRPIEWRDGWPTLADPLSGSGTVGHGPAYVRVVNRASGAALDNPTCGYEGADVTLAAPGGACAQWRLEDRGDGYASVLNRFSNKVLDLAFCVDADGARIGLWGWLDNPCQEFRLTSTSEGWSVIENRLSGRVLAPAGCAGAGVPIQTFTRTGEPCQEFRVDPVGDVLIADDTGTGVLTSCQGPVTVGPRRATPCQLWRFTPTSEGYFQVTNPVTGGALSARGHTLVVGGRPTRWRLAALGDGGYHLVTRDGWSAQAGSGADPRRFQLLVP